jgi:ATP-binding cassette, subfamily B, multidrug efflux pump
MNSCRKEPIRLRRYVAPHARAIAWGVLLSLVTVGINTGIPFISRFVVDGLAEGNLGWLELARWLGIYAGATVVVTVLSYGMRQLPLRVGHQVEADIRRDLFNHLTGLDRGYFRAQHTGDLMNRLSTDVRSVGMGVGQGLMQNSRMVFVFVLAFGVMFRLNAALAGMILLLVPLMVGSFAWFANHSKRGHLAVQEELSEMATFNQEAFTGIQTIKSFGLEPRWLELFRRRNESLMGRNLRLAYVQEGLRPLAGFWFALSSVVVLLAGGRMVIQERLTLGELVQFTQYLLYMQWPLLSLGWVLGLMQRSWGSWERIRDVMAQEAAIADSEGAAPPPAGTPLDIEFDHVTLKAGDTTLLDDICLAIPAGARVGITGPTGSGKTVLVSLLPRLQDAASGAVRIGGRDVREIPLAELRGWIGMAEQEPVLFSDTLANNIGFGAPEATEEAILTAADLAHLHADVERFPGRYATRVGERGVTLSGGQRQRTSIGRALSRDPRILILDDVLASVDTETEAAILGKLQGVFSTRTTLLVSHRASTLAGMDWIVVVEDGRITQRGTHAELARQPGYYRRLHDMQQLAAAI